MKDFKILLIETTQLKKTIILLSLLNLFIPLTSAFAQGKWEMLESPTRLQLSKIFCTDSLNCWTAGDSGIILNTSDGGINWVIQNSGVSGKIQDIFFLNHRIGWAVSARFDSVFGSYLLKTTNGGEVWEKEFFNIENKFFHTIYFHDSLNGWVAGSPYQAFYGTTDGGSTWNSPGFDSSNFASLPVQKIVFFSKQYGIACGGLHDLIGVIWKTTDAGLSWFAKDMGYEPLRDLYFIDSLNIIGVGGDFEFGTAVARTSDGGDNWIYELPGFLGTATGLSFRKKNEAWACLPSENKFILSTDSGKTWKDFNTYNNASIYSLAFTDSSHGFAVGDSGVILKYRYDYISDIGKNKTTLPLTINLFQNFPNPFNPSTNIQYAIGSRQFVQIKVYNVLGNEVAILVNKEQPSGTYEIEFNPESSIRNLPAGRQGLASGVYFYQLKTESSVETKKMILMK